MVFGNLCRRLADTVRGFRKNTETWDDSLFSLYNYTATLLLCLIIVGGFALYFAVENRKVHTEFEKYKAHTLNITNQWHICVVEYASVVDRFETLITIRD